jgi:lysophospholipase L1-like esterase
MHLSSINVLQRHFTCSLRSSDASFQVYVPIIIEPGRNNSYNIHLNTSHGGMMKTIVCYGDSNTWGQDGLTKTRYPMDVRWTGVLRNELGADYWVIEEGLCGRTTVWDDPIEGEWKNGLRYLMPCLESQAPIDLVVLMLGTNDLKNRYAVSAFDIANGLGKELADLCGCEFLDASQVIRSSDVDGVHLDPEAHQKLGLKVAERVRRILA